MKELIKPHALTKNSVIGIAAASSSFSAEKFQKGLQVLKSLGFRIKYSVDMLDRKEGYLAGADDIRASELSLLLNDPEVDAVMFARGGYGIQRIMNQIDFSGLKKNPKLIIGYSDLTALTSFVTTNLDMICLYGPVVTGLSVENEITISSLHKALTFRTPLETISGKSLKIIKEGKCSGKLLGGCLSILSSSIGTDYELTADGSVLFIEDFNEKIYKYDRMLTQLENASVLDGVGGIIFGSMGLVENEKEKQLWKMVADVLSDFAGPVIAGLSSGHSTPFLTLPLGVECSLMAGSDAQLIFKEPAVV